MKSQSKNNKSAIDLIEKSIHIIRKAPIGIFYYYYLGTFPFILAFLYFCSDMSKNAFAGEYCLVAAFGLSLLFVWMKSWQSVFCIKIYESTGQFKMPAFSFKSVLRLVYTQAVVHSTSIIILPAALLITLPFAWTYAVYQMVMINDYSQNNDVKSIIKDCYCAAKQYTKVNHILIAVLLFFAVFVFMNIAVTVYMLPHLLKTFTSIETYFTMGGFSIFNSTYLLVVFSLSYLCIDPLVKVIFTAEKFYADATKTGADLLTDLKAVKTAGSIFIVVLIVALSFLPSVVVRAETSQVKDSMAIDSDNLRESIQKVMSKREYAWRMPREKTKGYESEFLNAIYNFFRPVVKKAGEAAKRIIETIVNFIRRLFPEKIKPDMDLKEKKEYQPEVLLTLVLIAAVIIIFLVLFWQIKSKKLQKSVIVEKDELKIDVLDENVMANELPEEKWVELANKYLSQQKFRLAIRALYLGTLACLSANNYVSIASYKSNLEYEAELYRRAYSKKRLIEDFKLSTRIIDRIWYGMQAVTRNDVDSFAKIQKRIVTIAG